MCRDQHRRTPHRRPHPRRRGAICRRLTSTRPTIFPMWLRLPAKCGGQPTPCFETRFQHTGPHFLALPTEAHQRGDRIRNADPAEHVARPPMKRAIRVRPATIAFCSTRTNSASWRSPRASRRRAGRGSRHLDSRAGPPCPCSAAPSLSPRKPPRARRDHRGRADQLRLLAQG